MTQAVIEHTPSTWHGLPAAVKSALGLKSMKWWVLGAALLGFALPALVAFLLPLPASMDPQKQGLTEWTWLSMQVINLLSCSIAVGFAPLAVKKGFPFCAAALQLTLCIMAACVGFKLSPWGQVQFSTALTLCALFIGQAWLWMGASAFASYLFFFAPRVSRVIVALKLALFITALLWSRPYLLSLYRNSPAWAVPATQTLVEFSPVTAASSVWNLKENSVDLFKAPITYDLWIGSYQPVMYAKVWPGRGDEPADAVVPLEGNAGLVERVCWSALMLFRRVVTGLGLIPFCVLVGLIFLIGVDYLGQRKSPRPPLGGEGR